MYYKLNEQGTIISSSEIQRDSTWLKTNKEIVRGYDGVLYFKGEEPQKPQELINQEEILELKQYLNETDWYYARQFETGETIPDDVRQKRIESRNRINELQGTESTDNTTTESETTELEATDESTTESES